MAFSASPKPSGVPVTIQCTECDEFFDHRIADQKDLENVTCPNCKATGDLTITLFKKEGDSEEQG